MKTKNLPNPLKAMQLETDLENLEDIELVQQRTDGPFVEVELTDL